MIFLLIGVLLVGGCGIVPNGYGGYCTAGPDCDRQHEQMRSPGRPAWHAVSQSPHQGIPGLDGLRGGP